MATASSENSIKTVLELDLASFSDISRVLEENLDVYATKAFQDQIQSFVDRGLEHVGLVREDVVLGTAGDNALLVFDDARVMHRFAQAVQQAVAAHNRDKTVDSAKRSFRMGAATGAVLLLQEERRIVGTTVARAVRLEAAAKTGQLLVDAATYDLFPDAVKGLYGAEEEISGKREERFLARRCTFVPAADGGRSPRRAVDYRIYLAVGVVALLLCSAVVAYLVANRGPAGPVVTSVEVNAYTSDDDVAPDARLHFQLFTEDRESGAPPRVVAKIRYGPEETKGGLYWQDINRLLPMPLTDTVRIGEKGRLRVRVETTGRIHWNVMFRVRYTTSAGDLRQTALKEFTFRDNMEQTVLEFTW